MHYCISFSDCPQYWGGSAEKVIDAIVDKARENNELPLTHDKTQDDARMYIVQNLEFATWGIDKAGKVWIQSYKLKHDPVHIYWGPYAPDSYGVAGKEYVDNSRGEYSDALGEDVCYQGT